MRGSAGEGGHAVVHVIDHDLNGDHAEYVLQQGGAVLILHDVGHAVVAAVLGQLGGSLQGVVHQLSGVVAGQVDHGGVGAVDLVHQAVALGVGDDVASPGGVVLVSAVVRVITQDGQHGLGAGSHGDGTGGHVVAQAVAGDILVGHQVVDVALSPVAGDVLHAGRGAQVSVGVVVTGSGEVHQLRPGSAVDGALRIKGAIGEAVDDAQVNAEGNGVLVLDFVPVGEVRSDFLGFGGGSDGEHTQDHHQGQAQRQNLLQVLHRKFLLFNLDFRGHLAPFVLRCP
ncbi:MAG: hypothetical protein NC311_15450 [Muribaculaceae bacterium]|nr:hypothetical protein [Muribaculaceae bacterium]